MLKKLSECYSEIVVLRIEWDSLCSPRRARVIQEQSLSGKALNELQESIENAGNGGLQIYMDLPGYECIPVLNIKSAGNSSYGVVMNSDRWVLQDYDKWEPAIRMSAVDYVKESN